MLVAFDLARQGLIAHAAARLKSMLTTICCQTAACDLLLDLVLNLTFRRRSRRLLWHNRFAFVRPGVAIDMYFWAFIVPKRGTWADLCRLTGPDGMRSVIDTPWLASFVEMLSHTSWLDCCFLFVRFLWHGRSQKRASGMRFLHVFHPGLQSFNKDWTRKKWNTQK